MYKRTIRKSIHKSITLTTILLNTHTDDGYHNFVLLVACLLFCQFNLNCKRQTEYKKTLLVCHVIEYNRLLLNQYSLRYTHDGK